MRKQIEIDFSMIKSKNAENNICSNLSCIFIKIALFVLHFFDKFN